MKINLRGEERLQTHDYMMRFLYKETRTMAAELAVDEWTMIDWCFHDRKGLEHFRDHLQSTYKVFVSVFWYTNQNEDIVAAGLDFHEDENFTLLLLKIK